MRRGRPTKKKKSPMELSLQLLRKEGYRCGITEKWNPFAKVRNDLHGYVDIEALNATRNIALHVQTTTLSNINARINKIKEGSAWLDWLAISPTHKIEVHGWALQRERGTKRFHYEVRRIEINGV